MLPSYFNYIFGYLKPKIRLRPELSPKFWSTLGPNPARTRARPEKPGPTYNSGFGIQCPSKYCLIVSYLYCLKQKCSETLIRSKRSISGARAFAPSQPGKKTRSRRTSPLQYRCPLPTPKRQIHDSCGRLVIVHASRVLSPKHKLFAFKIQVFRLRVFPCCFDLLVCHLKRGPPLAPLACTPGTITSAQLDVSDSLVMPTNSIKVL